MVKSKKEILKKYIGKGGLTRPASFVPIGGGMKDAVNGVSSGIAGGVKGPGNSLTAEATKKAVTSRNPLPLGNAPQALKIPDIKNTNFSRMIARGLKKK